jgi:WD40 repeat protein/tRNA A-37 threonylcarbamoyl transferase component Bud32
VKLHCPHCGSELDSGEGTVTEAECPECGAAFSLAAEAETLNVSSEQPTVTQGSSPDGALPTGPGDGEEDSSAPTVTTQPGPGSEAQPPTDARPQVRVNCIDCGREFLMCAGQADAACPRCGASFSVPSDHPGEPTGTGSLDSADTIVAGRKPEGQDRRPPPDTPGSDDTSLTWMRRHFEGKYEILDFVSRGGMGAVYRARQERPAREVALKVMLGGAFASTTNKRRFAREAQAVAKLKHPAVVPVYEFGEAAGQPYFTMEFVEGVNLRDYSLSRQLSREEICRMMVRVCDAIEYAHKHGVIHRDLKPGNILVDELGRPRILDFGLSRATTPEGEEMSLLTATGDFMGTPRYMSPEQAWGSPKEVDERTDVYSLGAMLYELLVGLPPYPIENVKGLQALDRLRTAKPLTPSALHPDMPRDLEVILLKSVARDKRERYDSAEALASDLESFLADRPIAARPPSWGYLLEKWILRHRKVVLPAGGLVLLGAVLGLAFFLHYRGLRHRADTLEDTHDQATLQLILSDPERGLREFVGAGDWQEAYDYARFGPRLLPLAERGSVDYLVDKVRYRADRYVDDALAELAAMVREGRFEEARSRAQALREEADGMPYEDLAELMAGPAADLPEYAWPIVAKRIRCEWSRASAQEGVAAFTAAFPGTPEAAEAAALLEDVSALPDDEFLSRLDAAFERALERRDWTAAEDLLTSARRLAQEPGSALTDWLEHIDSMAGGLAGVIRVPTVSDLRQLRTLETPKLTGGGFPYTKCLAFSPDGSVLATGAHNGGLSLWDSESGEPLRTVAMGDEIRSVAFAPDGSLLAVGLGDGRLALVRLPEGTVEVEWPAGGNSGGRIESLSFSRDGKRLLSADKDAVAMWDVAATRKAGSGRRQDLGRIGGARPAAMSPDGRLLAVYSASEHVRVWHLEPPFPLSALPTLSRPSGLVFGPDSDLVAASYANGPVWMWEVDSDRSATKLLPSDDPTLGMALSPDGRLLATGGRDETVRLWDVQTGNVVATQAEPNGWIYALGFSPEARWLAVGGNEPTIRLYGVRPRPGVD